MEKACDVCCGNGHFKSGLVKVDCKDCNGTGRVIEMREDIGPAPDGPDGTTGQ